MNKTLGFGLVAASVAALAWACSDDDGPGNCVGDDCVPAVVDPTGGSGGSDAAGGSGGAAPAGGSGGGGSVAPPPDDAVTPVGAPLAISEGVASSEDASIFGAVYPVENSAAGDKATRGVASVIDELTADGNQICMRGRIRTVKEGENGPAYDQYWGVLAGMNLNQVAAATVAPVADAGVVEGDAGLVGGDAGVGDAGAPAAAEGPALGDVPAPWPPGHQGGGPVVTDAGQIEGFAFTLVPNNGVPLPLGMRLNMELSDPDLVKGESPLRAGPNFCAPFNPVSGAQHEVKFTNVSDRCWGELPEWNFRPPIVNLGWQIPADLDQEYDYDFCITDIRPILSE